MRSQRLKILEYLKTHKEGLNSYQATYELGLGKQAPTRIKELRDEGYNISSIDQSDRSVNWVLDSRGDYRLGKPAKTDLLLVKSPSLKDLYIFTADGRAVLKTDIEPRQEALL